MTNNSRFKFRAWNKKNNAMADLWKITPLVLDPELELDGIFIPFDDDLIVMQWTGLVDKHGKDIYEGDIDSLGCVFTYNVKMGCWYRMKKGEGTQWHSDVVIQGSLPFEIIGDIYQNPELLEEKSCTKNL